MRNDHDLLDRAPDVPPGRQRPRRPKPAVLGAAGVVLVALLVTGVAAVVTREDEPPVAESEGAVATTVVATVPTVAPRPGQPVAGDPPPNSPKPRTSIAVPLRPPDSAVAATDQRLVTLNALTGAETRELMKLPPLRPQPEVAPTRFEHVAVTPDGTTVYYVTCCEPAVGFTQQVPRSGGTSTAFADGMSPAASPDGSTVAVANGVLGVALLTRDGRVVGLIRTRPDLATLNWVAWSPDSQQLAVVAMNRLFVVPSGANSLTEGRELMAPSGRTWSSPVFRTDGSLLVIETGPGTARSVRPVAGQGPPRPALDLGGRTPTRLAADVSGGWVAVLTAEGDVMAVGPDGAVTTTAMRGTFRSLDW
ncbi:MAG: hypothetical protein ACRD2W_05605 [Acidimicrobiales bacterium]